MNKRRTEILDVIAARRSVRAFTGGAVSRDDLTAILKAGMAAPSAVNVQPWAFVAVTKRETLDALCATLPYAKMLDKAGAAMVVCGLPRKDLQYSERYWVMDCSAATENILLAVHALGYGAVWTAVYPDMGLVKAVRQILSIPEDAIPLNVIPIGMPADNEPPTDKWRSENAHWEKW